MAHRLAREVCALGTLLALTGSLMIFQPGPAAADHFLTHGDALKVESAARPVPLPVPAAQQARVDPRDGTAQPRRVVVHDANVYLAPQAAGDDALLRNYSASVAPQAKAQGVAVPGLLGIAAQAYRARASNGAGANGQAPQTYSLADAMRDAIWRKQTARRLRELFED